MLQSRSFTLDKTEEKKRESLKIPWKGWAKFLIIPGLIGFILLLILTNIPEKEKSTSKERAFREVALSYDQAVENDYCKKDSKDGCFFTCSDTSSAVIVQVMTEFSLEERCIRIKLHVRNCEFPDDTLPNEWLTGNFLLKELVIAQSNLKAIEKYAFDSDVFKNMTVLEITGAGIQMLYNETFKRMSVLQDLKIRNAVQNFEPGYLKDVRDTLVYFDIQGVLAKQSPTGIFGSVELPRTVGVDLRSNNFANLIDRNTFDNLIQVRNLYLSNCGITSIGAGAFDKIAATLKILDLKNNRLTTISGDLFRPLKPVEPNSIMLSGNPWRCDCGLVSLANYYTESSKVVEKDIKCDSPKDLEDKPINFTVCETTTETITTETTTSAFTTTDTYYTTTLESITTDVSEATDPSPTTEISTSTEGDNCLVEVFCSNCSGNVCENGSGGSQESLKLRPRDANFSLAAISMNAVQVSVENANFDFAILWFSDATRDLLRMETNYKDYGLGCRKRVVQNFAISGLQSATSYTFCLVKEEESMISPFNCDSYYMPDKFQPDDYWLLYDDQTTIISLCGIGVLLSVFLGAFIMYCIIRCRPTLLRGNKRVIILNKSTTDVMILPRNNRSSTDTVMNTANTTVSSQSFSFKRDNPKRKLSTDSEASGRSYVIPEMMYEVVENRKINEFRKDNIYFEKMPENSPPPLPKRLSSENILPSHVHSHHLHLPSAPDYNDYILTNSCA